MSGHVDEETPLLVGNENGTKQPTPLPWAQFSILLFLQLSEPLTSNVIFPFAPQLIRDIGITHGNESKVGYYVGLMQSLFFLIQAFTVLHWSRLSDRIGRKPVILTGLFGLSASMFCFGLSKTFWGLVLSRSLNGALNGNIGVIKSMIAEMTDTTNIARASAYVPVAWSFGTTLGPFIGGFLARPAERFPDLFGQNAFLKKYPYFLPCAIPATFSLTAWLVTFLFLKETLATPISIRRLFSVATDRKQPTLQNAIGSTVAPVATIHGPNVTTVQNLDDDCPQAERPLPLRSLLTPRVMIAAGNYASLSLVEIALRAIQPVFLSTPIELGGLGLPVPAIGKLLALSGILNGIFQIPIFILFPVANTLARSQGCSTAVWTVIVFQIILGILPGLSYNCIFIFISGASPNRASLGATNGLCQMSVSIMRAIGPAAANSLFSLSIEKNYLGGYLVYYALVVVTGVALVLGSTLPQQISRD